MNLERDVPMGDPTATLCRWGHGARVPVSGALLCPPCDGYGYTTAVANGAAS